MNQLFILGYNAVGYFCDWFKYEENPNTKLRFVDNGKQNIPDYIKRDVLWVTTKNLGCCGGWNFICDVAFNTMELDKIIIGEEDARFSEEILNEITEKTSPTVLCGTYDNSFEFSLYGIHRDTWNKVGRFDENFLFCGCEDNDYKHRCKLAGVSVISLGISHYFNGNSSNNDVVKPKESSIYNGEYVKNKWGEYTYQCPFNNPNYTHEMTYMFKKYYPNITEWPSVSEFEIYQSK